MSRWLLLLLCSLLQGCTANRSLAVDMQRDTTKETQLETDISYLTMASDNTNIRISEIRYFPPDSVGHQAVESEKTIDYNRQANDSTVLMADVGVTVSEEEVLDLQAEEEEKSGGLSFMIYICAGLALILAIIISVKLM